MKTDHKNFILAQFKNYEVQFNFLEEQIKDIIWNCDTNNGFFSSPEYLNYLYACHLDMEKRSLFFIVKNPQMILSRITLHLSRDENYLYTVDDFVLLPEFNSACPIADKKVILGYFFDLISYLKNYYGKLSVRLVLPPTTEITRILDLVEACNHSTFDQTVLMFSQLKIADKIKINRKSYRNLINYAQKNYNFNIIYNSRNFRIDEYFNFHKEVSGRQTREFNSWLEQQNWIKKKEAFIVECRDKNNLIGYTFMRIFDGDGLYFSGVYSRDTQFKGVGHGCLYESLCFCKSLELNSVFLGYAAAKIDVHKLKTIRQFKLGFADKLDFRVRLNWT